MKKSLFENIVLTILLIGIFPFLYLSFFSQPIADDFAFAYQFKYSDYFSLIDETYHKWGGRYFAYPLIYLNPISFDSFLGYRLVPMFLILITIILFCKLISSIAVLSRKQNVMVGLTITLLFLVNLPKISEHIYWYTGAIAYHLGLLVFIALIISVIKINREKEATKRVVLFILCGVLLFVSIGFNEGLSVLTLLFVTLLTITQWSKKAFKIYLVFLLLAIIFLAIMLGAPGNFERITAYKNNADITHSMLNSLKQTVRFTVEWVFSLPLIFSTLVFIICHEDIKKSIIHKGAFLNKWLTMFLLFLPVFFCSFLPYWATGILGQHRTINIAWFFFMVLWFINLHAWLNHYKIAYPSSKLLKQASLGLFLISIFISGNGYGTIKDLVSGAAKNYKAELDVRHKIIQESTADTINVQPLQAKPNTLFVLDITENPEGWTNKSYNQYFETDKPIKLKTAE